MNSFFSRWALSLVSLGVGFDKYKSKESVLPLDLPRPCPSGPAHKKMNLFSFVFGGAHEKQRATETCQTIELVKGTRKQEAG